MKEEEVLAMSENLTEHVEEAITLKEEFTDDFEEWPHIRDEVFNESKKNLGRNGDKKFQERRKASRRRL